MRAHGIVPESRTAPEDGKRRSRPRDEGKHADDGAGAPKKFEHLGWNLDHEYHPKNLRTPRRETEQGGLCRVEPGAAPARALEERAPRDLGAGSADVGR